MPVTKESVIAALQQIELPDGGTLISRDMLRALSVDDGTVRFVIEAPSPEIARQMTALQRIAEQAFEVDQRQPGENLLDARMLVALAPIVVDLVGGKRRFAPEKPCDPFPRHARGIGVIRFVP